MSPFEKELLNEVERVLGNLVLETGLEPGDEDYEVWISFQNWLEERVGI